MYEFDDEEERPRRGRAVVALLVLATGGWFAYQRLGDSDTGGGAGVGLTFDSISVDAPASTAQDTAAPTSDEVLPSVSTCCRPAPRPR